MLVHRFAKKEDARVFDPEPVRANVRKHDGALPFWTAFYVKRWCEWVNFSMRTTGHVWTQPCHGFVYGHVHSAYQQFVFASKLGTLPNTESP